jgi:ATP-binding cassette, subfamily B, bacterial
VIKPSLSKLEFRFGSREAIWWPWCLGIITGLVVPAVILTIGGIAFILIRSRFGAIPQNVELGPWIRIPTAIFGGAISPMRALITLVSMATGLTILGAWLLHCLYRWVIRFSVLLEVALRKELFSTYFSNAQQLGIAGQKAFLHDADSLWIPQVRDGVFGWYRSFHRYTAQGVGCFAIALCIHPILTLLTAVAFLLVWRIFGLVDRRQRRHQPILSERSHNALQQVHGLATQSMQLALLHPKAVLDQQLDGYLRSFREAETKLRYSYVVRTPLLAGIVAIIASVFSIAVGVHILRPTPSIDGTAAMTLIALIGAGFVATIKVVRCCSRVRLAEPAALRLLARLDQPPSIPLDSMTIPAGRLADGFELDHVSIDDANGHHVLHDLRLEAKPGTIVAILGSKREEVLIMLELIFGLGRPSHGKILWDNVALEKLHQDSLSKLRSWIEPSGPLISGTLFENLSPTNPNRPIADLVDATRAAGVYDAIGELPETFSTLVSQDDDRLKGDALFRVGIARALLKQSSMVVAIEPTEDSNRLSTSELVNALRELAKQGAIVFVLPRHGSTLRNADKVVLLHDHRIVGTGKHEELLKNHELYRHLNYMLFSPYKHVVGADV